MLATRPRPSGLMTATADTAWSSAHSLRCASAFFLVMTPTATIAASTTTIVNAAMRSPRRESAGGVGSGDMRFSDRRGGGLAFAFVHQAENDRHEHQRCNCSKNQAADDGAAERCVLLAAFAEAERH